MRIGYVIWSLGLGGAEQVVMRLAEEISSRGHEVTLFTLNEPGVFAPQMMYKGIPVLSLCKRGKLDFSVLGKLKRQFQMRRLDVVHTHLWGANFWGRVAARLARVPVVIAHEHGMQPWRGWLHYRLDRWLYGKTNRVLFVSRQVMREFLAKSGLKESRCTLIPNGVDDKPCVESRQRLRREFGWRDEERVIISVGRLSVEKGYEDLVRAFARVARLAPRVRLVILGEGQERQALERLREEVGLNGQVTFAGLRDDVKRWLAAADFYVQPSRREGLSLAILEAMVAGLPVVATRVGDVDQVIRDGQEGYLVEANDPDALAQALLRVLGQPTYLQLPVVGAAKRVIQDRYSLRRMVDVVERLYSDELATS